MKILFSGDPHGRMSTIDTFRSYLDFMLATQIEHKPHFTVISGDLFHDHALIRSEIMNLWLNYLRICGTNNVLMKGNHDETAPGSKIHALAAFEEIANHKVVGNEAFILPGDGNYTVACIPYIKDIKSMSCEIDKIASVIDPKKTILFTHQAWDGVMFDNGMYAPDGFPVNIVKDFKVVVSGHIHKEQSFGNIIYPGTPYSQGFVDADQNKSLWLIDTDTLEFKRLPTTMPRYFVKELEADQFINWFDSKQSREGRRHHYKVILKDSKSAIRALRDSKEFKKIRKHFKLRICTEYKDVVRADRISESITPEKMMEKYVYEIMNTKLNRTELFKMANTIMRGG